jgi:hypothetical protein
MAELGHALSALLNLVPAFSGDIPGWLWLWFKAAKADMLS